jgi:hypothetical protein
MAVSLPTDEEWEDMRPRINRLSRQEFLTEVFGPHYRPGQHVAILGPTQSGKTTLVYAMLDEVATPSLPAIVLVMKPRDDVVKRWSKLAGFKKTETWPPVVQRGVTRKSGGFGKKRRGWVFWPRHNLGDIRRDDRFLERAFRQILTECYKKGDRIVFADEVLGLVRLNLETELTAIWERGASMGCGLWAAAQRPFHAPVIMYGSSEHVIIFKDGDKRSIDRYGEIGGVDKEAVASAVMSLRKHEFLYIGRNMAEDEVSPAMAIVSAD